MSLDETLYLIPYLGSVLITASVSAYAFQKKDIRCARLLAWFSMAMCLSTVGFIIETVVPSLDAKIFWDDMQWIPDSAVIICALLMAKEYTGERWKRPKLAVAAITIPTLTIPILVFTDPWHGLMHQDAQIVDSWPFKELTYRFTAPVYLFVAYIYVTFIYAITRMALVLRTPMGHHRTQILFMTLALAVPILVSTITILELFTFIHRDLSPFSFAISAGLMAIGIFRYRLLEILPLARGLIVNAMVDGFVVLDKSCLVIDYNVSAKSLFVGDHQSQIGRSAEEVLPVWQAAKKHGFSCCTGICPIEFTYSSEQNAFEISIASILDKGKQLQAFLLTAHDISNHDNIERALRGKGVELEQEVTAKSQKLATLTQRLHKEEDDLGDVLQALQDSEEVYRSIFELARFGIIIRNADGKALSANPEALHIFGMTLNEFLDKSPFQLIAPEYHDTLKRALAKMKKEGDASLRVEVLHQSGRRIQAEIKGREFTLKGLTHMMFLVQDVTEHFQAVQSVKESKKELLATFATLQESESRFKTILNLSTVGIAVRPIGGKPISVNKEMLRIFDLTQEEYMNSSLDDLAPEANREDMARFKKGLQECGESHLEAILQRRNNPPIDIEISSRVITIDGEAHMATAVRDITKRAQATRDLQSREAELSKAQQVAKLAYWTINASTGKLDCSDALFNMLGLDSHEASIESLASAIHPDDRESDLKKLATAVEEHEPFDVVHHILLSDNTSRYLHSMGEPTETEADGSPIYFGITQDVTEEVTAIKATDQVQARLESNQRLLADAERVGNAGSWEWNIRANEVRWSKQLCDIFGFTPETDLIPIEIAWNNIHPNDIDRLQKLTETCMKEGGVVHTEYRVIRPDDKVVWVEVSAEYELDDDGLPVRATGLIRDISKEVASKSAIEQLLYTTNATGDQFFEALVLGLASAFEVKYAFVGKLSEDNKRVKTIAICADGEIVNGIEYGLQGTPCTNVIGKEICFHKQGVAKIFPGDELLVEMGIESYLGVPLWRATGKPLGVLALLGTNPMNKDVFPEDMLKILSSRAAIELERQQTQSELLENQQLLTSAESIGHTGSWRWDIRTTETIWSAGMYILHGTTPEEFELTLESAFSRIHPDDVERLQGVMATGMAEGGVFEYEYRIIRLDSQIVRLKSRINYIKDATGKPISANGIVRDITQEHKAQTQRENLLTQVTQLKDELEQERDYLRHELKVNTEFGAIIGDSEPTRKVLSKIEAVAGTDASVLINGQSGVGKELVASAIHEKSNRREGAFIKVNCASIPAELFESEFFGHVKGAFSGAVRDRVGRFQAADGGTLFLDEVGEIPINLQSKLLRVLQEGEFERVGEDISRKVDVRVIAATNRDLELESKEGRFRNDLFFRLNVFPLSVPTLAERRADIIPLAMHFIDKCTRRIGREPYELSRKQAEFLESQPWPGNVRELQHVIERAVILSKGDRLSLELAFNDTKKVSRETAPDEKEAGQDYLTDTELKEFERQNLIAVLDATNWVISGKEGAAARIGIKPSTLTSRMKSMKINKPDKSVSN